jgi:hypothetical protein
MVLRATIDRVRGGLDILRTAYEYAADVQCTSWDFAVAVAEVRAVGMTESDLRWLGCKGYVEFAAETTPAAATSRTFQPHGPLALAAATCLVLTEAGYRFTCEHAAALSIAEQNGRVALGVTRMATESSLERPRWDADRQELRFEGRLVKRFKAPAPNQEAILAVFEEEGWPPRIDDPLSPVADQDPKRRLLDTIKCLNRNQKHASLHFLGDGTGRGVRWEAAMDSTDARGD